MYRPTAKRTILLRIAGSLYAGTIAIALNEAALLGANLVHLQTAHGGLLKLFVQLTGVPAPHDDTFNIGFHVTVGLIMAVVYGLVLQPLWRGPPWLLGLAYAAVVWIANAFVLLPLIGQGIAGSATLSTAGILWFAAAHTLFFISLSMLYRNWVPDKANRER